MPYNKNELLALPVAEKVKLAEELWSSVENKLSPTTEEEIAFAGERLKIHEENSNEGLTIEEFKKHFAERRGF